MSKLKQAIALNVEHKKRHSELYARMCSTEDTISFVASCAIMREGAKHHEALRNLGYRHRDLDMDGPGPIRDVHSTGPESRHWLIRITKAWIEHRKRRRRLLDVAQGFRTNFIVYNPWKKMFPHYLEFKSEAGTMEQNWKRADRIQGFCNKRTVDFERAWKKLRLDEDISRVWKDKQNEPEQETGKKRIQRKRVRPRRT